MQPYEELISQLGELIGIPLKADERQACVIDFPMDQVSVQIDLDTQGDRLLVGCDLGALQPGSHRELALKRGLRVNALPRVPRGIVAFSERKDCLILFQYLPLAQTTPEALFEFLKHFVNHARLWVEALSQGDIPRIEQQPQSSGPSGMLGLS